MDESFHFNTSRLVGLEVPRALDAPTRFERWVVNRGVAGCQRDHFNFSVAVNGIFWYDPALFPVIYKLLRSPVFGMDDHEARAMMAACFTRESEGLAASAQTHGVAAESYRAFVEPVAWLDGGNREMRHDATEPVRALPRAQPARARALPPRVSHASRRVSGDGVRARRPAGSRQPAAAPQRAQFAAAVRLPQRAVRHLPDRGGAGRRTRSNRPTRRRPRRSTSTRPGNPRARLACQLPLTADVRVRKIESA